MLLNRMTRVAVLVVAIWGLLVSLTPTSYAGSFHVEISTVDLGQSPANANSPFYLNFQFNDGGVLGNNSANITNFSFAGGSASGSPIYSGSVGDLSSNVRFNNSSPFEEFFQSFTPGATIGFDVFLTQNVDGITPDSFFVSILDKNLLNIPTSGLGDSLVQIDLNSSGPLTVNLGAGTGLYAGVTASAVAVPEPGSIGMLGMGIACIVGYGWRRRSQK